MPLTAQDKAKIESLLRNNVPVNDILDIIGSRASKSAVYRCKANLEAYGTITRPPEARPKGPALVHWVHHSSDGTLSETNLATARSTVMKNVIRKRNYQTTEPLDSRSKAESDESSQDLIDRKKKTQMSIRNQMLRKWAADSQVLTSGQTMHVAQIEPSNIDPFNCWVIPMDSEKQRLFTFWVKLDTTFDDLRMSNAASARDQLQSHLHSEAALRAILLTAKLLSDSFEQNTPSASASRQALALKQDAIAAVNNALTRNINRAEFDSMSYALYLLMLIEGPDKDFATMLLHMRGLLQWAETFGGVLSIPVNVVISVSILATKIAACTLTRPAFPAPPLTAGPSLEYQTAAAAYNYQAGPTCTAVEIDPDMRAIWRQMQQQALYIHVRTVNPGCLTPEDVLYFKRIGYKIEHTNVCLAYEGRTSRNDPTLELCALVTYIIPHTLLFALPPDAPTIINPFLRVRALLADKVIAAGLTKDVLLYINATCLACSQDHKELRAFFLAGLARLLYEMNIRSWPGFRERLERFFLIEHLFARHYQDALGEAMYVIDSVEEWSNGHMETMARIPTIYASRNRAGRPSSLPLPAGWMDFAPVSAWMKRTLNQTSHPDMSKQPVEAITEEEAFAESMRGDIFDQAARKAFEKLTWRGH